MLMRLSSGLNYYVALRGGTAKIPRGKGGETPGKTGEGQRRKGRCDHRNCQQGPDEQFAGVALLKCRKETPRKDEAT